MKTRRTIAVGIGILALLAGGGRLALRAAPADASPVAAPPAQPRPPGSAAVAASPRPGEIQAEPPPFSEGVFPCSECHEGAGDPTRRELGAHEDVQAAFDHDAENRWCLDCHDNQKRDVLRLASGAHVPFTESYRLCGQCHGDKYRDWRSGIHGKRVGHWDGERTYLLCVNCHNPHSPRFKAIKPDARPQRPEEIKR